MSISNYAESALLDALFNNTSLAVAARYVKLHTGDPGENGTASAAGETTRKSVTGAAAVSGTFTSVNDLIWTNVSTSETYSHISLWDHVSAGNCLWTGALSASKAVNAGDTFTIVTAGLVVSLD